MAEPIETPIGTITPAHFQPGQVSHRLFLGPKFLYALFNPRDRMHVVSEAFLKFLRAGDLPYRRLLVNEHIVDETATRLKKQASMRHAEKFITTLEESDLYHLLTVSVDVFERAQTTFLDWTDLDASFTDFVVATHMTDEGVDYIATYDRHYDAFDVTTVPYHRS
jgi:predicted nucleic acid-binding protein